MLAVFAPGKVRATCSMASRLAESDSSYAAKAYCSRSSCVDTQFGLSPQGDDVLSFMSVIPWLQAVKVKSDSERRAAFFIVFPMANFSFNCSSRYWLIFDCFTCFLLCR
ncbi:hypothetical protein VCHA38O206_50088 [Vibrio chagasii]|nr:hypothetical protein VCHA36O163_60085 [Vibrio chagasii]CAH7042887.1 hypothetical protein VCHA35P150_60087 [Vibrio chagasii]CAH7348884.1 hypothetical protein VCHA38O206_50088 [Vibrio chagasii]CAH7477650.1 hypothetical protein VCHA37O177_80088 [Vibrio chagasii]